MTEGRLFLLLFLGLLNLAWGTAMIARSSSPLLTILGVGNVSIAAYVFFTFAHELLTQGYSG